MSGKLPKQQKSRSAKDGFGTPDQDLAVLTKEEVVETVKEISIEEEAEKGSFFDRFKSDEDEGEEDGQHG